MSLDDAFREVNFVTGQYNNCKLVPAHPSNYRGGRRAPIDRIIIHVTQGDSAIGAVNWFARDRRPGPPSSAHYTIEKDGVITQSVLEQDTAYGAPNFNARGIHIEHTGWVNKTVFSHNMIEASADLVRHLCEKYDIPKDRVHILGHSELPGNDHTDPGDRWPWKLYMQLVQGGKPSPAIWQHKDGIQVAGTVSFGFKWPEGTNHCSIVADGRWLLWNGNPDKVIKLLLTSKGPRKLTATAYGNDNKELARDELEVVVA